MKKKIIAVIIASAAIVAILIAGAVIYGIKRNENNAADKPPDHTESMSVTVPNGWKTFLSYDLMDTQKTGPTSISIYKDANESSPLSAPDMLVRYYGSEQPANTNPMDSYKIAEYIIPFEAGAFTWEGYIAANSASRVVTLWTKDRDDKIMVDIWLDNGGKTLDLNDKNVKNIIAKITLNK